MLGQAGIDGCTLTVVKEEWCSQAGKTQPCQFCINCTFGTEHQNVSATKFAREVMHKSKWFVTWRKGIFGSGAAQTNKPKLHQKTESRGLINSDCNGTILALQCAHAGDILDAAHADLATPALGTLNGDQAML
jgi:hypothetical protein